MVPFLPLWEVTRWTGWQNRSRPGTWIPVWNASFRPFKSSVGIRLSCGSLSVVPDEDIIPKVGTETMLGEGGIGSIKPHFNHVGLSYCLTIIGLAATIKIIFPLWVTKPWLSQPVQLTRSSEPTCLLETPFLPTEISQDSKSVIQHTSYPFHECDWQTPDVLRLVTHLKRSAGGKVSSAPSMASKTCPAAVTLTPLSSAPSYRPSGAVIHHYHRPPVYVSPPLPQKHHDKFYLRAKF